MRHKIERKKLNISAWDDVHIPGLGVGYVIDKAQYGVRGKKKQVVYSVVLHDEYKNEGVGGYFVKEQWIREEEGSFFIDIDELLLDAFNAIT